MLQFRYLGFHDKNNTTIQKLLIFPTYIIKIYYLIQQIGPLSIIVYQLSTTSGAATVYPSGGT